MTDDEREKIAKHAADGARADANLQNRLKAVEEDMESLKTSVTWGVRAIWAGAIYLATQLWTFIANGGSLK